MSARLLLRGGIAGVFVGLLLLELLVLAAKIIADAPLGEATVAIGTLALAGATIALATATFRLVRTTAEEMDLLRQQTAALKAQAGIATTQLRELREQRIADAMPQVIWELGGGESGAENVGDGRIRIVVRPSLVNLAGLVYVGTFLGLETSHENNYVPPTPGPLVAGGSREFEIRFGPFPPDFNEDIHGAFKVEVRSANVPEARTWAELDIRIVRGLRWFDVTVRDVSQNAGGT